MFHWFSLWKETTKNGDYQFFYVLYIMFCNNWMIFCYIIMTIIHLYMINTINALWHIVLINSDSHESSRRPFPISIWSNQISGCKLANQNEFLIESTWGITQGQSEMRSSKSYLKDYNLLFSTNFHQCFISWFLENPGFHFFKLINFQLTCSLWCM